MFGIFKKKRTMADDKLSLVFGASITASILVAFSDGKMNQKERDRLVETIGAGRGNEMSPREILVQVEQHVSMVKSAPPEAWPSIMAKLAEGLSDESKNFILHVAGNMALVDGKFSSNEITKIADIARWIGVGLPELKIWFKEFQETIDDATFSGMLTDIEK